VPDWPSRHGAFVGPLAGTLRQYLGGSRSKSLQRVPMADLANELLARASQGEFDTEASVLIGCQLQDALHRALDVHRNRFSAVRYRDTVWTIHQARRYVDVDLDGATVLDLGCGSLNPYGTVFLLLLLGARRGIAVDLDAIQDLSRALQAVVDCAALMLVDPAAVAGDVAVSREAILARLEGFDLARIRAGDVSGLDAARLSYRQESITALSLDRGEVDLVISNAVLEHLADVDAALAELARVTRSGGVHVHTIDGSDHRRYDDPSWHPLAFLTEAGEHPLTHGSNRLRPLEFVDRFGQHGFELLAFVPIEEVPLARGFRARLMERFRAMTDQALQVVGGRLYLRRR